MEIIHLSVDTPMQVHDSVCALGFFDGVHLGHQQLLKEVEHIAKEKGLKKAIMTFSVHPKQILENNDYHYLMSLSEKINISSLYSKLSRGRKKIRESISKSGGN